MADCRTCKRTDVKCCNTCYSKQETCEVLHFCGVDCGAYQPRYTTNADRIRSMTDEELAEFIGGLGACISNDDEYCYKFKNCNDCRLAWLKSEVEK